MSYRCWRALNNALVAVCTSVLLLQGAEVFGDFALTISLQPSPYFAVSPNGTADFDLFVQDYAANNSTDAIISIGLNVQASDPLLTGNNSDFSAFSFGLDPSLSGIFGGVVFDGDISDDGYVEFGADLPPVGTETGILQSHGDLRLGTLSVTAPATLGLYEVALHVDSGDPLSGTFALVDDGSLPAQVLPGDGPLSVQNSAVNVIPEPSALSLFLSLGVLMGMVRLFRPGPCRKRAGG